MVITLKPEQEAWLKSLVAKGDFPSVEAAARHLIDERIAQRTAADKDDLANDLAWAKPYVEEARAAVARGESVSLEEHKAHNAALLASCRP